MKCLLIMCLVFEGIMIVIGFATGGGMLGSWGCTYDSDYYYYCDIGTVAWGFVTGAVSVIGMILGIISLV